MKIVSKEFEYKEHRFKITVFLRVKAERRLGGIQYSTVKIKCLTGYDWNYTFTDIREEDLKAFVTKQEAAIKQVLDMEGKFINPLADLGYKEETN
jgi:hypothetical protein